MRCKYKNNSKYTCDNGLFLEHTELKNFIDDAQSGKISKDMSDCVTKAFSHDKKHPFKGISSCFNKYGYGECDDSSAYNVILIIIIVLAGLFLLLKGGCFIYDFYKK